MQPKPGPDLKVAIHLAKPFTVTKGRSSAPLSFRMQPDGGMVVITADGRKLWFTAVEVAAAREAISGGAGLPDSPAPRPTSRFRPTGLLRGDEKPGSYDGMPSLIVLPPKRPSPK